LMDTSKRRVRQLTGDSRADTGKGAKCTLFHLTVI
jgi:hypothetical protein